MKKIILLVFTVVSSIIVSAQCDYTLRMIDSYGDGWNGNTIDVLVNGAVVLDDATLASGSGEDLAITVNTGDEITTIWNGGGSYGSETSYQILDVSGNEVGAGAQTSIETAITVNCPSCNIVSAIDASNISTSGGDVSWTAGGSESAWNIEYGTSGFALGSGSSATSTNPNYSISGLNGGTLYDVYVQADCGSGETSDWTGPYSFSTLGSCGGYTLTLVDTYGDGWNGGVVNVFINSNAAGSYTIASGAGPEVYTIQTNIGDVIEFAYTAGSYPGENEYTVANELGEVVAEEGQGGGTPGSVTFTACASCPDISLAALTVNAESAVASWNPEDEFTSYTLEIGDTGFVLGTGTTYTTSDTSYTFTGLTENTYYSFYLSPTCGADAGTAQGPYSFQTFCNTITTGWSEDWSDFSGCRWSTYNLNGDGYGWILTTNGDYGISNYGATSSNDYLMSPVFTCSDGISDRIRFDAKNIYVQYGDQYRDTLTVGLYDAGVTALVGVLGTIVPETDYTTFEYDLSLYEGQDVRFFVHSGVSSGANLNGISYIDNVIADAFPSCDAPSDLTASNVTSTSTDLAWTELATATSWNIEYGLSGFVQGDGTIETSSSTSYTLTNLESASTYDVYVQSDCGSGEVSDWIGPVTFSTPGTCGFITVELVDDYGDGWNGNSLEVVVNSTTVGTYTVSSGASASYIFPTNTGDIFDFNYLNTGTWGGENGWNVYDEDGNLILEVPFTGNGGATGAGPENTVGFEPCYCEEVNEITVEECNTFTWSDGNGETYTEGGIYSFENGINNDGCYIIEILDLTINSDVTDSITASACDSYEYNGVPLLESGSYDSTGVTDKGCAYTQTLELTINESETNNYTVTECDSYIWNGETYTESGNYDFIGTTDEGCDLTENLTLIINESTISPTETISECDSYTWADGDGNTYTGSGIYTNETTNSVGCTLTQTLDLTINLSIETFDQASSCDSYDWNGQTYSLSGSYSNFSSTDEGCDLNENLDLTINASSETFEQASSCDSYTWNGVIYTESGNYDFTGTTTEGCNLTENLSLIINESTSSTETISSCGSFDWNGTTYTESGTYTNESTNSAGCTLNQILELTITTEGNTTEATACDSYEWNGQTYNVSGTYSNNNAGCIDELILTINLSSETFEQASSCDSYDWNGLNYTESGNYANFSSTAEGCDLTENLELTINASSETFEQASSCDSYTWTNGDGETYTESGNYTYTSQDANGCDNIINLTLTLNASTSSFEQASSCDSYSWNGQTYTETGTYSVESTNAAGCNDLATLDLTINVSSETFEQASSCDSYSWNGLNYTESGNYTNFGSTAEGCDLTENLELTINLSSETFEQASSCDSFTWADGNGETYTESGSYSYITSDANGCDNTVNLILTINASTNSFEQASSCENYYWNGETYTESGSYTVESTSAAGCDIVETLELTINNIYNESIVENACDSFEWNDSTYTQSGAYEYSGTSISGCDSIVELTLTINESNSIDVTVIECEADTYVWDGETYSASGSYTNSYQNANGCDSIVTLDLTFNDPYAGEFLEELDETRANFAAPTNLPGCWTLENSGLSSWANSGGGITVLGLNGYVSGPSSGADGEGEYLYVQTYNFDAGGWAGHNDSSMITTKDVDLSSLSNPELYFNYQLHGVDMGHLSVWINDGSGLTEIFSENGQMGNLWYEASVDLSSYSGTVSFSILSVLDSTSTGVVYNSEMAIDNFGVREQLSCYDPYNLLVDDISGSTATVSWMTHPSITSWNYVFGDPGIDPDSATVITTTSSTLEIEDLAFASQYEMYVQSDCGTDWEGPLVINVPFPDDYGCTHTLNMFDSYGDGWNGGSIDVLINGATAIAAGTIVTGAEESIEFGAEDGDDITITNFVPGSWSSEISFNITDGSGTVIYSSGEAGDLDASSVIDTTVTGSCPENDLVAIAGAVPSGCDLSSEEVLEIWVYNAGVGAETAFTVSYSVNGSAEVTEEITDTLNSGDTLMHMFATTADMSSAGEYNVTMSCSLSTDVLNTNDTIYAMGMNIASPEAPTVMGDTICSGDTANLMAMSNENIVWYDAEDNVVGLGENLMTMDTATTSYFAQAAVAEGFSDDFESYTAGDFIAQSNTEHWATWPGGELGGQYDAPVSNDQAASGSNSLHLDNAEPNVPDPVMIFGGQTWNSGSFEFSMNMYVATTAYFNLQGSANIGTIWAMQMTFDNQGGYDFGDGAIAGSYPGTGEWFNINLKCNDLTTSTWELFIDGESQGSVDLPNGSSVAGCNFYAADGNDYYVDDVSWTAISSDACRSDLVEVVNTVEECVGINEFNYNNVSIYPNPSNGEFMVANNVDITTISITDAQGKVVHSLNNINLNKVNIDITNLEKGMYLINIETVNGTITKPVMVK